MMHYWHCSLEFFRYTILRFKKKEIKKKRRRVVWKSRATAVKMSQSFRAINVQFIFIHKLNFPRESTIK